MEITDKISHSTQEAFDKIASVASQTTEILSEKGEQMKTAEQRLMKKGCRYVRNNPGTSMGIAVAAGVLLSFLIKRR